MQRVTLDVEALREKARRKIADRLLQFLTYEAGNVQNVRGIVLYATGNPSAPYRARMILGNKSLPVVADNPHDAIVGVLQERERLPGKGEL